MDFWIISLGINICVGIGCLLLFSLWVFNDWIRVDVVCCVIWFVGCEVVVNGGKVCCENGLFLNLVIVSVVGIFIFCICVLNKVFVVILLL